MRTCPSLYAPARFTTAGRLFSPWRSPPSRIFFACLMTLTAVLGYSAEPAAAVASSALDPLATGTVSLAALAATTVALGQYMHEMLQAATPTASVYRRGRSPASTRSTRFHTNPAQAVGRAAAALRLVFAPLVEGTTPSSPPTNWPYDKYWMEWSTGQTSIDGSWNWRGIAISSDGSKRTGAKNNGYLYLSSDYGLTWTEDTSVGSVQNWVGVSMSGDGAVQAAWGYSSAGMWTSTDSGASWTYREPTGSSVSWYHVAISTDGVRMTAAPDTGQLTQLYVSSDSGATWTATGPIKVWSNVAISSDGTIQTAASENAVGAGQTGNLWRSTDYGVYDCAEHRTLVSSRLDARSP